MNVRCRIGIGLKGPLFRYFTFLQIFRRQVFIHLNQLHTARIDIWASVLVLLCFVLVRRGYHFLLIITWILPSFIIFYREKSKEIPVKN